ncbi:MAG: alpha-D-ribose 1-methylphosphonate 5-triphosphate diphosphatase [Pseudomonadota bacterium]
MALAPHPGTSGVMQTFVGAEVYLPDTIAETTVTIDGGTIVEIGGPVQGAEVDARGKVLAPALIDVHGDAFERQVMPRPGVFFPMETAVLETDRQLAANGIATTYHSITLGYEPGLRSVEQGRAMMQAIRDLAPRLTVENRVQLRWETFAFEALDTLDWAMEAPLRPSLAFNDHLSMAMRSKCTAIQERAFEHSPAFAVMDIGDADLFAQRYRKHTERSGLDYDDHKALVHRVWDRRAQVVETMQDVAARARDRGIPMLSHDDTQAETRAFYHGLGATTSEFPMSMGPVEAARKNGDMIVFGAPNAVRGGSHIGSLGAADMVEAGFCDMLASDYYYPAMLAAIDRLDREKRADRTALWSLISSGPARAMGLTDRGEIRVGKRADLVLVDWPAGHTPAIQGTWVAGRCAYRAQPNQ